MQESAFQRLVAAASGAPFYRTWFETGNSVSPDTIRTLPRITLGQIQTHPAEFRSQRRSNGKLPDFRYPLRNEPKVALLVDGFRTTSRVRNFSDFDMDELQELESDTLAAPLPLMRELAAKGHRQNYPIVVFTGLRYGYLTESDRDLFWQVFRVPLFEQFTGFGGEVLAEECEAHEGLHIRTADALFETYHGELLVTSLVRLDYPIFRLATGFFGVIEERPCACGRNTPRLLQTLG